MPEPSRLAVASGLRIGGTRKVELGLLRSFLLGELTEEVPVDRLIVAGGVHADKHAEMECREGRLKRSWLAGGGVQRPVAAAAEEADLFLAPLSCRMRLCLQSGEGDCGVSAMLPQPAMPRAIFPRCRCNLELWSNPASQVISKVQVVGHAGQPLALALREAARGAKPRSAAEIQLQCWREQYLAPVWPDLLAPKARCGSSARPDPFSIELSREASKVLLFAGNCKAPQWEFLPASSESTRKRHEEKDVLAICVPDFTEDPSILLINEDLSVQLIKFRLD
ncbi:unnamed protein product [Effrenium voratum]|nr:unnamed protein product [Effrenium voratum]